MVTLTGAETLYNLSTACRVCGATLLESIYDFGDQPLANALLTAEQLALPEPKYPLHLVFCPACSTVQITTTMVPEKIFRNYLYFSSYSNTMLAHARRLAKHLVSTRKLGRESLVVEIASNDGYLLQYFVEAGIPVLGVEPAYNIARAAMAKGIPTVTEFFDQELVSQLVASRGQADILIAANVLAHAADLHGLVAGVQLLLKPEGVAIFEVPYIKNLIERLEFDTIYHEHLCYFSLTSLDRLFCQHQLTIVDVELIPVHGGSLRLFVAPENPNLERPRVQSLLAQELADGLDTINYYNHFGSRIQRLKSSTQGLLRDLKSRGRRLAAYGAGAKGCVFLNTFDLDQRLIDFVVDRNPHKQGCYLPGVRIPIVAPASLLSERPDYALLLTWNLTEEILAQTIEYQQQGGRFVVPIPELKIL